MFYVGIDPKNGEFVCSESFLFPEVHYFEKVEENDIAKIDGMYEKIKLSSEEQFDQACICLNSAYGNEIRKKFIESGIKAGFSVDLIDTNTAEFFKALGFLQNDLDYGNIIWIAKESKIYVRQIIDGKAEHIGEWVADILKIDDLKSVLLKSKVNQGPDIFIHEKKIVVDENILKQVSPTCKVYYYNSIKDELHGALNYAIKSSESYETHTILQQKIVASLDGKEIFSIVEGENLPIIKYATFKKQESNDIVKIDAYETTTLPLPDRNTVTIRFEVDQNGIYDITIFPQKVVIINEKNVLVYEENRDNPLQPNVTSFPATIDYGSNTPKIGVNYESPTVIKDIVKHFGVVPKSGPNFTRQRCSLTETKNYYVLKFKTYKKEIDEEKVVGDLFEEAIRRSKITKDYITLTIPFHFNHVQKDKYLKIAEMVGFTNITAVDEQDALALGYEKQYKIAPAKYFMLIYFCDPKVKLTVHQTGNCGNRTFFRRLCDYNSDTVSRMKFFDDIIDTAIDENFNNKNGADDIVQDIINAVNRAKNMLFTLDSIVITHDKVNYAILQDCFPNINVLFIENPEQLILKGATYF